MPGLLRSRAHDGPRCRTGPHPSRVNRSDSNADGEREHPGEGRDQHDVRRDDDADAQATAAHLAGHPREEQHDRVEHHAQDVVAGPLDVGRHGGGGGFGLLVQPGCFLAGRHAVLRHGERRLRCRAVDEGVGRQPGVERRLELRPEPVDVERPAAQSRRDPRHRSTR